MSKYKIFALIGAAGSGKDTILKNVLKEDSSIHEIVSCTTRPPREGEINGKNYFFLTNDEFAEKVLNMEMLEATCFRDWFYGTSLDSLDKNKINIGVFNPDGIRLLLDCPEVELTIFYVRASAKTRLLRQLNREENPDVAEIIRRYNTDEKDFSFLDFDYYDLTNEYQDDLKKSVAYVRNIIRSENP